jgi:glycosyltransferase involved in cell wall biosynthesis
MNIKNKKTKVIHIITGLRDGGAEAVLYRLATHDGEHRHYVITLMNEGKYGPQLREAGVTVYCLDMKQGRIKMSSLLHLWRILNRERPEIVQTWMYHADLVGGVVAKLAGVGRVFWGIRHTTLEPGKSKRGTIYVSRLCALLSHWVPSKIVCCANKAAEVHANLGYAQQKLVVIQNGYDIERFCSDYKARDRLRNEWGIGVTMPLLGMVGRFDPQKDHKNLIDALAQLKQTGQVFQFVLVGNGLSLDNWELVEWIDAQNLHDQIILLGPRTDIPSVMNALDLHVFSSSGEAFPNVVAEAMACGTPCVTTDVGDVKMILGQTGWVVPPRNSQALSQAMAKALSNRAGDLAAWSTRQKAARSRIVEYFSLDTMVQAYNDVWDVGRFSTDQ